MTSDHIWYFLVTGTPCGTHSGANTIPDNAVEAT